MKDIIKNIHILSEKLNKQIKIMEVCGTHTRCIYEYGIHSILPKNI